MYATTNKQKRCNRMSAYAFNKDAGLGSGADWQPVCGLIKDGEWLHIVGEYTLLTQPANCPNAQAFPGSINIWVNGVEWKQEKHKPTGCMSQYKVKPQALDSPFTIGTMARDFWFKGGIGKVAIYNRLLSQPEIAAHYQAMTGRQPTGDCGENCTF
jgi:hypothetical protein